MLSVKWLAIFVFVALFSDVLRSDEKQHPIKICTDGADWRPFVYQESGQLKGLHIDIVAKTLKELNMDFEFVPSPWKRCLKGAEKGVFDAIATASFSQERAQYLLYPRDASELISAYRVGQVQYNIIVHISSDYQYKDELKDIPMPIRVPREYSIGKDLRGMGFEVDDSSLDDLQNLKRLIREKNGAVIALPALVPWAQQQSEFKGEIRLIDKPIKSKSYFLAFAKNGRVDSAMANRIWGEIQIIRRSNQYTEYSSYNQ